ncbi:hypothetical protein V8E52_007101 [Russula decolorans]
MPAMTTTTTTALLFLLLHYSIHDCSLSMARIMAGTMTRRMSRRRKRTLTSAACTRCVHPKSARAGSCSCLCVIVFVLMMATMMTTMTMLRGVNEPPSGRRDDGRGG